MAMPMLALNSGADLSAPEFSASIGIAMFKGDGQDGEEVMKQADIAVNEAKASGRNALRFFDPEMQAALAARATRKARCARRSLIAALSFISSRR